MHNHGFSLNLMLIILNFIVKKYFNIILLYSNCRYIYAKNN